MSRGYPDIPEELQRRLGCFYRFRFRGSRPQDGGDYFDTYEGWQKRGRQVRKGADSLTRRAPLEAPSYPYDQTVPLHPQTQDTQCLKHNSSETSAETPNPAPRRNK